MPSIRVLSDADVDALNVPTDDVLGAVERGLIAYAAGETVTEPTASFRPLPEHPGLLSVIRGSVPKSRTALVKTVGTFPENTAAGLATNPGLVMVLDAGTGEPRGLISAARITTMRTAAVTALGARVTARIDSRVLGCIGSCGIVMQAARYIAGMFDLDEIRVHSRSPENRGTAARALTSETGVSARACADWAECLTGADIMIEGASLTAHAELFPLDALQGGTTLIAYGAYSSMPADVVDRIDRIVMDRWVDGDTGALGPSVAAGCLTKRSISAYLGDALAGQTDARTNARECVLVWHRGVAACDVELSAFIMDRAARSGVGQLIVL